jgi:hypothetical protein
MNLLRPLLLLAIFAGAAAHTSPALAAVINRSGTSCVPQEGYVVGYDQDGIHSVAPNYAYIFCINNSQEQRIDVSRVDVQLFDTSTQENILCVVRGEVDGQTTFGPYVVVGDQGDHQVSTVGVDVPFNNQTKLVVLHCYLPGVPSPIEPHLMSYSITTR